MLLRRLLRRLRLRRRLLRPLRDRSSVPVWAGAICVNFAISFAPCAAVLAQPYKTYDAARTLEPH